MADFKEKLTALSVRNRKTGSRSIALEKAILFVEKHFISPKKDTKKGPTARGTWKAFERKVASFFNSERTPLSGGNSKITRSDSLHPKFYIECKYKNAISVISLFKTEVAPRAEVERKIPLLALKQKGDEGEYLLLRFSDIESFIKLYKENGENRQ